jgi:hypothetical protein
MAGEKKLVKEVLGRYQSLKTRRRSWEDSWQELSDLVSPRRGSFSWDSGEENGKKHSSNIYDSTAITSARIMADGLLGYCAPQNTNWFAFRFLQDKLNQIDSIAEWLDQCEKIMMQLLDRSGFYDSFAEMANDAVSLGTATTWVTADPVEHKLIFKVRHPKEIFIDENRFGEVDVVYRRYKMEGREAVDAFGEENLTEEFLEKVKEDPLEEHFFLHAVMPRKHRLAGKIDKKNKKYASYHILEDGQHLIREDGYDTFPYIVYRMRTNANEVYGRSPAWDVQSVILRVNQMHKDLLHLAHMISDGPVHVPQDKLEEYKKRWRPKGMLPYLDPKRIGIPAQVGGNFPVNREALSIDQQEIKSAFMVDVFLRLSAEDSRTRTATEANYIASEKTAVLGSLVSKINSDYFSRIFDRSWGICREMEWLPPPPPELGMYGGGEVKVDFIGPLPSAMKRYFNTRSIMEAMNNFAPLMQMFPGMRHLIEPIELGRHILQSGGMPEKIVRDRSKISQIQQAEAQAMQQQMENQDLEAKAEMISKTSEKPQKGSPADGYMKTMAAKAKAKAKKR